MKSKRKRCTWCGRLRPVRKLRSDPQFGADAPICRDRSDCNASVGVQEGGKP